MSLLLALIGAFVGTAAPRRLDVGPTAPYHTIAAAVADARDGDTIVVHAGTYREPQVVVARRIVLEGDGLPVLDGEGHHALMLVTADDVTVRGFVFRNVGTSFVEDRAALRADHVRGCSFDQIDSRMRSSASISRT